MRTHARRLMTAAALIVPAVPAVPAVAAGQGRGVAERRTLEGYVARYALNDKLGTVSTRSFTGFGARLLLERYFPDRPTTNPFSRTDAGLFAAYSSAQGTPSVSTLHVGLQTDVMIPPQPLGGVLDPFVSFGIGLFRTSREAQIAASDRKRIGKTDFTFTPAVGTRLGLVDRVGARIDARVPIVFGTYTTANFVAEGGVYFTF